MPLVSVIVPVYNGATYVRRCLDSLACQDLEDIEVIVVDDGSTDGTWPLIEHYVQRDRRFETSIRATHAGLGPTRNRGLERASGDYIAFVDADDYVDPQFCSLPYRMAHHDPVDIVMFGFWWVYSDRMIVHHPKCKTGMNAKKALLATTSVVWDKLYSRQFLQRCGLKFPAIYHEDEAVTPVLMAHQPRIAVLDKPLYHYVRHEDSICGLKVNRNSSDQLQAFRIVMEESLKRPEFKHELEYFAIRSLRRSVESWRGSDEEWAQANIQEADRLLRPLDHPDSENPYIWKRYRSPLMRLLHRIRRVASRRPTFTE